MRGPPWEGTVHMLLRVACILAIAFAGLVGPAAAAAPTGNPSPFGRQVSAEVKHDLGPALRDAPPAPRTVKGPVTIPVRRLPAPVMK